MRKTNLLGATFLALATSAWSLAAVAQTPPAPAPAPATAPAPEPTPAPAAPEAAPATPAPDASAPSTTAPAPAKKKPMHHKSMHGAGKLAPTKAGDKAVEDLNDASLNSAKSGKPFVAPTTPDAAKQEAHMPAHKKMHHMAKKKASTEAPADSSTPPADTSGK